MASWIPNDSPGSMPVNAKIPAISWLTKPCTQLQMNTARRSVARIHAVVPDPAFVIDVGPITDDEHLVCGGRSKAATRRGLPGAPAEAVGQ
jgi:hypothetical protein